MTQHDSVLVLELLAKAKAHRDNLTLTLDEGLQGRCLGENRRLAPARLDASELLRAPTGLAPCAYQLLPSSSTLERIKASRCLAPVPGDCPAASSLP